MESKTGNESPQSINITFYYKGFSIQVTKRDPNVEVKPLVENAMRGIDWGISVGLKPSWNTETNKEALGEQKKSISTQPGATDPTTDWLGEKGSVKMCPIHPGKEMTAKEGKFGTFYSHWLGKDTNGKSLYCNGKVK